MLMVLLGDLLDVVVVLDMEVVEGMVEAEVVVDMEAVEGIVEAAAVVVEGEDRTL